jgi:geranylgeranyl pyrophosphate synthase
VSGRSSPDFDLGCYLESEREAIERARERLVEELLTGVPEGVAAPVRYALDAGGKRLRPILVVAAYRAAGGDCEAAEGRGIHDVACAVEFVHTYSLVHDDLPCMDDDDLRRGKPTTHRVYGSDRAVVAGAALIPLAVLAMVRGGRSLGLEGMEIAAMVRELCEAAGATGMVGGQLLDLDAEGVPVSLSNLEAIHQRKTGALLAASLRIGGVAARADGAVLEALGEYGRCVGLAFQIADDVLDLTGETAKLGKTAGRDVALEKATYPSLLGIDGAIARARAEAEAAVAALRRSGIDTPELVALAHYAVERDR